MARRRQKTDRNLENQINLFDMIEEINPKKFDAPDFQIETKPLGLRIKEAISEAIKNSGLKRYAIAGQMSEYLGLEISESMLNSWTAESKEGHRMPAEYYPIFCKLTQDYTILDILMSAAGGRMVKSEEIYLLEMGRLQQAEKTIRQKQSQLQREWNRVRGVR
ncbi:hypothetical protein [Propionispora vibrioides]|uniref:Uncharacterized protein n=1 Tax=Propionispora vibrioides TaxID=112903 RepID=A0A1H8U3C4_9FIRM|nr:hypothetical protein [Propionispora vibrioides]SEO97635.1 hypothetical protein SAMN04490178_10813 [Propionispora vibrioides]